MSGKKSPGPRNAVPVLAMDEVDVQVPDLTGDSGLTLMLRTITDESGVDTVTIEALVPTGGYDVAHGDSDTAPYIYSLDMVSDLPDPDGGATLVLDLGRPDADPAAPIASTEPIRVVLAHREPLMLRGIASLLAEEGGFEVVGEAVCGDEAVGLVRRHTPDLLVIDTELPDREGLDVIDELRKLGCPTRPVVMASRIAESTFLRARRLGVRGVVLTTMPPRLLVQCLRTVHAGEEFLEKDALIRALKTLMRGSAATGPKGGELTEREREVVELVAAGLSNHQIAERLGIGNGTIKSHLASIFDKLGVHSRYALMRFEGTASSA